MVKILFNIYEDIDWLSILLLEDVVKNLGGSDLKELSLVSGLARDYLKPLVHKNILLNNSILSSDIYFFGLSNASRDELFNSKEVYEYKRSKQYQLGFNKSDYKCLVIDPYLQVMKDKFQNHSTFVKSFKFYCVYQSCYYLINLVELTTNLTHLEVNIGFLLFKDFQLILNGLHSLEELYLSNVTFVKFKTDKLEYNGLSFPKSLKKLTVHTLLLIERNRRKGAYQLLFGGFSIKPTPLPLKLEHLPNLEYFDYDTNCHIESFLFNYFKINSQIKYLKIPFNILMQDNMKLIWPLKSLKYLFIYYPSFENDKFADTDCSVLNSITELGMTPVSNVSSILFFKLLLACKNLKILNISLLGKYSLFLKNCIPQLISLNSLYIDSRWSLSLKNFDFSSFTNIEHLTIGLQYEVALNLRFHTKNKLKTVLIQFDNPEYLDIEPLRVKFGNIKGWSCRINEEWIRCYRVNSIKH